MSKKNRRKKQKNKKIWVFDENIGKCKAVSKKNPNYVWKDGVFTRRPST